MRFVTQRVKVGELQKQVLERTFGGHYGVHYVRVKAVEFGLCQLREILNDMHMIFYVMLTVVVICDRTRKTKEVINENP